MERLAVSGPSITDLEISYVNEAVQTAWYSNANVFHDRFESAFAKYLQVAHAMALPSCTSAIHLALASLGVGSGDEVIVPDITWIASSAPISYVGATPVFADIDAKTWCLSAASMEECITARTKAVIPVDLYGNLADLDAIEALAQRHGIAVIEDAAEAIGSEFRGRKAGSFGDAAAFSFHGSKTLTTGEGGMLITRRDELHRRALQLRDHGRELGDTMFRNSEVGFKYRMSSMQAALGLAQLERIEELVAHKRQIFAWYAAELSKVEGVTLNHEAPGTKNTYWMVTTILDPGFGISKDRVIHRLREQGIDCRPFFEPLSSLKAYAGQEQARLAQARNRVSYEISPYGINLPSGMNMTEGRVARVCQSLRHILSC